jgi:ribosomal protein S18 acetylase RimI-like enzyme
MPHAAGMTTDVVRAERALFRRASQAGAAASAAGIGGRFVTWRPDGLLAVLATHPGLGFLCTVSGVTWDTVAAVPGVLRSAARDGVRPAVIAAAEFADVLSANGLVPAGERVLAVRTLVDPPDGPVGVTEAGESFADLLVAGYQVTGVVADYIRAEHAMPGMRRLHAVEDGTPIASAAMTCHGDVAVLGGASTLPAHRGRGAQSRLLAHRLRLAAAEHRTLAVATARPDSVSEANLVRSGFRIHRRLAWTSAR